MTSAIEAFRSFAHAHDELPAFRAAYIALAFLVAALLNLGAFAVLIAAHMMLDVFKYRDVHRLSWKLTVEGVLRESLVDVTLLVVGIVFAVYLHHSVWIASVSGLMRAELTVLRAMGMLLPKAKILHDVLMVMAHIHYYLEQVHPKLRKGWSQLEVLCLHFLVIALLLLTFAAPLMGVHWEFVRDVLLDEMVPGLA